MRQLVSTALVALVVAALTAVTVSAVAQETAPVAPAAVSPINADRVDGKHAVGAGTSIGKRKNRLVTTDRTGYLPSNIVRPQWDLIGGMPLGFADGVDDAGLAGLKVTVKSDTTSIDPGGIGSIAVDCPIGSQMVGGGHYASEWAVHNVASYPYLNGWRASFQNMNSLMGGQIYAYVFCLSTIPEGNITQAGKVAPARLPKRGK